MDAPLLPDGSNQLLGEAEQILDYVRGRVAGKYARTEADRYHGFAHAQEVDEHVQAMCAAGDIQVTRLEELALRVAALMHDVGYTEYSPAWSQDRREHIRASLDFAMDVLRDAPDPNAQGAFATVVGYLIAHHDDTNYKHPSMAWGGGIQSVPLGRHADRLDDFEEHLTAKQRRRRLGVLVGAIREADSLMGTGQAGAVRTFEYSVARGLPVFAPRCPLSAWCWEESAIGNVRLAAKRALIDAATLAGRRRARQQYEEMERFVAGVCERSQIPYYRETFFTAGADRSEADDVLSPAGFQLERYEGWQSPDALRAIPLFATRGAPVDANARIEVRPYAVSALTPRVAAVSRAAVERCRGLHACLVRDYALSLFDLTGTVEYWADGSSHRIAPAVVATGCDPATGSATTTIVDGRHRAWLARQLGVEAIWTVSIDAAGGQPPAARAALTWEDVQEVDSEP